MGRRVGDEGLVAIKRVPKSVLRKERVRIGVENEVSIMSVSLFPILFISYPISYNEFYTGSRPSWNRESL
jgi:hypothetical protein